MSALNEKLLRQLECPICFETCVPPIYMCTNGHCICSKCQPKVDDCSTCRAPGKPTLRCIKLEQIVELVDIPCANKARGCDFLYNLEELKKHLPLCEYGFKCLICHKWKGSTTDLKNHVSDAHTVNFVDVPSSGEITKGTNALKQESRFLMLLSYNDKLFWMGLTVVGGVVSCPMRLVNHSPKEAAKFYYSVEFPSFVSKIKVTYQGEVLNLTDFARSADTEFTIPTSIIESYGDKAVVFILVIKKK